MQQSSECQINFFSSLINSQSIVSIYLKNGIKLTGTIIATSENVIFLNTPILQMIYKDRVSTICLEKKTTA